MFTRISSLLLLLLSIGAFGGASCYFEYDDDDSCDDDFDDDDDGSDDDDFCDDDDDFDLSLGPDFKAEDYRLREFQVVPAADPTLSPIESIHAILGVSIFGILGPGEYGAPEFELFTSRILLANQDVLGLPPGAGTLVHDSVDFLREGVAVSYRQEIPNAEGEPVRVPDALLVFLFDPLGNLQLIQNSTVHRPSPLAPALR